MKGDKMAEKLSKKKRKESIDLGNHWQSKVKDTSERYGFVLETGRFSDCVVIAGRRKEKFQCHKILLAMVSSRFEKFFYEDGLSEVEFEDVNANVFRYALQHIYMQNLENTPFPYALAGKMLYMAKKFKMEFLRVILLDILTNEPWPIEHVLTIYNSVKLYGETTMINLTVDHIQDYKLDILHHTSVYKQNLTVFKFVIHSLQRRVPEIQIYHAIMRYCIEHKFFDEETEIQEAEAEEEDVEVEVATAEVEVATAEVEVEVEVATTEVEVEEYVPEFILQSDGTSANTSYLINMSGQEQQYEPKPKKTRKEKVKELTDIINFRMMTPHEFAVGPATSKLFTAEESYSMLLSICKEHSCNDLNAVLNFDAVTIDETASTGV